MIITQETVDKITDELFESDEEQAQRDMEGALDRQGELFSFTLALTEELSDDASQLAVYLCFAVLRMFEEGHLQPIPTITPAEVEAKWNENQEYFESLEDVDDHFMERIAEGLAAAQPQVLAYVLEALLEEDDELAITEDESGEIFFVLKTVIDLLHEKTAN